MATSRPQTLTPSPRHPPPLPPPKRPQDQKFSEWDHGWAWLDVDTTGAAGPKDGVYWCKAVGSTVQGDEGSHFNEVRRLVWSLWSAQGVQSTHVRAVHTVWWQR